MSSFFIADDVLLKFRNDFNASNNITQHIAKNALTHTSLSKALVNTKIADSLHTTFSDELDINTKVSDQKHSGRCWIFSFLNVIRAHVVHRYELDPTFEFSQSYIFFWDQFEKCNLFLHYMYELRDQPTDNEYVREMLKEPISDGGQWHMLQNIVLKYGMIPKHCMEETYQSGNTERLTHILCSRLREFAKDIRTKPVQNIAQTIQPMMFEVYCVLCMFLGEPPQTIRWEYNPSSENWAKKEWKKSKKRVSKNKKGAHTKESDIISGVGHTNLNNEKKKLKRKSTAITKNLKNHENIDKKPYEISNELTPLQFFNEYVQFPIEDYVTVIHYPHPDRPYHRSYTVKYLNNMVNGRTSNLYNVPMVDFKMITASSIDDGEPVWFCADVGKDISTKFGIMDPHAFEYTNVFRFDPHGWDKGLRMEYKDGIPNHAMVLRGYHQQQATNATTTSHSKDKSSSQISTSVVKRSSKRSSSQPTKTQKKQRRKHNTGSFQEAPHKSMPDKIFERWLVENSWGEYSGKDGNLVMSDAWFDRHVFEVAVHKKHIKGVWEGNEKDEVIVLQPWDVFGSLFHTQ